MFYTYIGKDSQEFIETKSINGYPYLIYIYILIYHQQKSLRNRSIYPSHIGRMLTAINECHYMIESNI